MQHSSTAVAAVQHVVCHPIRAQLYNGFKSMSAQLALTVNFSSKGCGAAAAHIPPPPAALKRHQQCAHSLQPQKQDQGQPAIAQQVRCLNCRAGRGVNALMSTQGGSKQTASQRCKWLYLRPCTNRPGLAQPSQTTAAFHRHYSIKQSAWSTPLHVNPGQTNNIAHHRPTPRTSQNSSTASLPHHTTCSGSVSGTASACSKHTDTDAQQGCSLAKRKGQ